MQTAGARDRSWEPGVPFHRDLVRVRESCGTHAWLRCFGTAWPRIIVDRWDNGTRTLASQVTKYLTAYKQAGGELDHLIQDVSRLSLLLLCCHSSAHPELSQSEVGEETWSYQIANPVPVRFWPVPPVGTSRACMEERWTAIENDPRWPAALGTLRARGFRPGDTSAPGYLAAAMGFDRAPYTGDVLSILLLSVWLTLKYHFAETPR